MKKQLFITAIVATMLALACNTSKKMQDTAQVAPPALPEFVMDDLLVTAPKMDSISEDLTVAMYRSTSERTFDLLHTKLDLRFDWAKQRVNGKATLTLKPYFFATDALVLDAKNFDFNSITLEGTNTPLKYDYNNEQITIRLGKKYTRTEEIKLLIDYVAKPEERVGLDGSTAISSDKGLFFINPKGEDTDKPMQIWSQGETEANSCWFPTIDKPNERCTQEMYLTIEDKFKTLSNGLLISSNKNADGTRTDYWKMDQPHAPYLFMVAIGEYAVVKEKWENIELSYYVEPAFEKDAKAIFPHTAELMTFFSDKLKVKYPWKKYAQVICRDYVSGAMENTSAVIFGEFMQNKERELIDVETNELIVAHEMFHHWFGDYVTCESWSNLTLNEGFANYSEYLWLEYKYGREAADNHWLTEIQGYFGQAKSKRHALIDFSYDNREDMFDAHSYNKGGLILHMLRTQLGDEAFFAALNYYLSKHAYTDVEGHELRMAFEDVSGQDLSWFFNQWYYTPGHPEVTITKNYDAVTGKLSVTIAQNQDGVNNAPVYRLPVAIDVYTDVGEKERFNITTNKRKETFSFPVKKAPKLVNVDAERVTLWDATYEKTAEELAFQFQNAPKLLDRQEALEALGGLYMESAEAKSVFEAALNDTHHGIRAAGVNISDITKPENEAKIQAMAVSDKHSEVRGAAIFRLGQTGDKKYAALAKQVLDKEQAYPVMSEAIQALYALDKENALVYIKNLEKEDNNSIIGALAAIYAENPSVENLPFFEKKMAKINGFDAVSFIGAYSQIVIGLDDANQTKGLATMKAIASDMVGSPWRRYGAAKAMNEMRTTYKSLNNTAKVTELTKIIEELKAKETNKQLKAVYDSF